MRVSFNQLVNYDSSLPGVRDCASLTASPDSLLLALGGLLDLTRGRAADRHPTGGGGSVFRQTAWRPHGPALRQSVAFPRLFPALSRDPVELIPSRYFSFISLFIFSSVPPVPVNVRQTCIDICVRQARIRQLQASKLKMSFFVQSEVTPPIKIVQSPVKNEVKA